MSSLYSIASEKPQDRYAFHSMHKIMEGKNHPCPANAAFAHPINPSKKLTQNLTTPLNLPGYYYHTPHEIAGKASSSSSTAFLRLTSVSSNTIFTPPSAPVVLLTPTFSFLLAAAASIAAGSKRFLRASII